MKKILLSLTIALSLFQGAMAYTYPANWLVTAPCGWDFVKSAIAGVPSRYCWARQDRGDVTFYGYLDLACSGSACKVPNNIFSK